MARGKVRGSGSRQSTVCHVNMCQCIHSETGRFRESFPRDASDMHNEPIFPALCDVMNPTTTPFAPLGIVSYGER